MFAFRLREAAPIPSGEASPFLTYVAGAFAPAIAALWPAPHAAFLTAPAQRRHLVCLALTLGAPTDPAAAERLLFGAFRRAVRDVSPGGPPGLERALGRLGESCWTAHDYRLLLRLLSEPRAAKILRHAEAIPVDRVRAVARLPSELLDAGAGSLDLTADSAAVLGECFEALSRREGEAGDPDRARRWLGTAGVSVFDVAADDINPELPPPPFAGTRRLVPLLTKAAVVDAARRYDNCLRGRIWSLSDGNFAVYEWLGQPTAVLEITRDRLFGWVLSQCSHAGNQPVLEPARGEIVAELRSMGVHVGRGSWLIEDALRRAADPDFRFAPVDRAIREAFGEYGD